MKEVAVQIQHDDNFDKVLAIAAKVGYENVSLGFGSSDCFHNADWQREIKRIEGLLSKHNLKCIQTHLPYYSFRDSADEIDKERERAMLRCTEASAYLGARWCAYHPRTVLANMGDPEKSMALAKEALEPLVKAAAQYGTGIAVENLPPYPGWDGYRFCATDYEDLCKLHDYFICKEIGVCWDFGHAHMADYDDVTAIEAVGNRIVATHMHNNRGDDDSHFLPSTGTIEWERLMSAFNAFYQGAYTLEIIYPNNGMLESYMAHSLDCIKYVSEIKANR